MKKWGEKRELVVPERCHCGRGRADLRIHLITQLGVSLTLALKVSHRILKPVPPCMLVEWAMESQLPCEIWLAGLHPEACVGGLQESRSPSNGTIPCSEGE